ncbi:protein EMSY-LIKE 3-like [Salvia divinorum]|uniref:Protein EMSY-LIKE 3-like n=1 Tax=Salvia divinorum TaxID=28513 RepID=A0ABD1FVR5_SALDI
MDEYGPYDSSGTDDDFPPPHHNRMSRGGRISGNGRPAAVGSMPYPRMYEETDMEAKIHQLEQEAYSSVLRAFKAQADAISWEKEGLITELRKELRLSNEEHRDLLNRVNADETIRRIREWRQSGALQPVMHNATQASREPVPSPSISASRKKQKIASSLPSQSFGGPTPSFHPQSMAVANQPSSSAAKRGPMMGAKGKKHKSMPPGASSMKMQYPSGPAGRGQFSNRMTGGLATEPVEGASFDSLIGRKVRTRWPDDNNFYEAVITNFNPIEGRHCLVYDLGTNHETIEWVDLTEISPEDIQWEGEDPGIFHHGGYGGPGHGPNRHLGRDSAPGAGRGRGMVKGQSRKDFQPSQNGIGKKGPDDIQLLHTDTLIKEVERVFSANHPDPVEIEKAKKVLKEHEQSLTEAIARLGDLSDGESDEGGRFLHAQAMDRE